ncbi:PREDICTED: protein FLX-like 2 [Camelina sativa]|uniref:Protein FLX-like 2 n=1 Tax=Camelina sativa TaxID=90675 RepID=A0ABM0SRX7_CAMSA|nr:PREDICTED: protein FLX-like 2 [Camelina sativa]XP_010415272.1 PREDICTED: protein FLX-like 2 [Camelina sativa]
MESNGRIHPSHHMRRPLPPGPGSIAHPEAFVGHGAIPPPSAAQGVYPSYNMLPPHEVMEQKFVAQHGELQRLAIENQRLGATHGSLRQELVAAQHELQMLQGQIGSMKSEREQRMRGLAEKVAKMETELQKSEAVKLELQQAHAEARSLVVAREELMPKLHQLTQELQKASSDVQQIPALMSELESLRQEYQQCRATYDYEKKFYNDHLESLQAMEKNYMTMAREVEKLQAQLMNSANSDRRAGGPYGSNINAEMDASGHQSGNSYYDDAYGHQGYIPQPVAGNATGPNPVVAASQYPYPTQPGYYPPRPGYNFPRGPPPGSYDPTTRLPTGPYGAPYPPGPSNNTPYGSAATACAHGNPSRR